MKYDKCYVFLTQGTHSLLERVNSLVHIKCIAMGGKVCYR